MCIVEKSGSTPPLKTTEHIVAYLDMLGASTRIAKDQDATLTEIYGLYKSTIKEAETNYVMKGTKIKKFSDNIIIAKELPSNPHEREQAIRDVLWWCSAFQNNAISGNFGWLTRGGITIGGLYLDDMVVWGKALLRAYELEKRLAKDPKIVIDPAILPELREYKKIADLMIQDTDGMYFLNFMNMAPVIGKSAKEGFERIKSELCGDDVYEKCCWHINYVNNWLEKIEPDSGERLSI